MNRWKASGIHLLLSIILVGIVLATLLSTWYPPAIMGISKAEGLIYILAGVDIVIGPLLTLIVYKVGKPSLKFDLSVIALLQLSALAFGLYTMWQSRPVFMVAAGDRFYLVYANEIDAKDLAQAQTPEYSKLSFRGAELVAATAPVDINKPLSFDPVPDIQNKPYYFMPYENYATQLLERSLPVKSDANSETPTPASVTAAITKWANANQQDLNKLRYVPINSSRGSGVMVMHVTNPEIREAININPWGIESYFN
jgi:hypothetical protein